MIRTISRAAILAGVTALAACAGDPRVHESPEQDVYTQHGVVRCQLYTRAVVYWDRAVDWPQGMPHELADKVCRDEGSRWAHGTDGGVYYGNVRPQARAVR